jgi:hypothetical protein
LRVPVRVRAACVLMFKKFWAPTDYGRRPGAPGVCSKPSIARARARARRVRIDVQKILGTRATKPPGKDHIHQIVFIVLSAAGLLLPVRDMIGAGGDP